MDMILEKYDGTRHPDVRMGKRTTEEVETEFKETFEMHHNVLNGYQGIGKVSKFEFVEYYAHLNSLIEQDSSFAMLLENVWNLDNRDNVES